MELKINTDAKIAYPDLKVSIVEVRFSGEPKFNQEIIDLKKALENKIKSDYKNPENLERVIKYNLFYKKFDSKVPMEFQIKSILNNKEIPMIHPVLICMFIAELKNIILTAGHDLDKLEDDTIEVLRSNGTEEYTKINEKVQKLKNNDIFAIDGTGIISSVLCGPDSRTKITDETENFLFMCYSFGLSNEEIENHMNDIIGYLKTLVKGNLESSAIKII
ncbi:MAG TPA: phenylalanine--tRNA ligase beta subunit-related protein [archaeon]|nr:phenylalanine--tRNA ligase beta subunit-related protein [archaeon]